MDERSEKFRAFNPIKLEGGLFTRVATLGAIAFGAYFILWCYSSGLNLKDPLIPILFLLAEGCHFLRFTLFSFDTWTVKTRQPFELTANLKADIFVSVQSEPISAVELTLIACNKIRYPHTTILLDFVGRPELESVARRMKCLYLSPSESDTERADLLNAGLENSTGEFILFLDGDSIPQPEALHRALGYFTNDQVGLVQFTQEFYNLDSAVHLSETRFRSGYPWQEPSLFFDVIQAGKQANSSSLWCGSCGVLRRTALEQIKGIARGVIREELFTTIRLHRDGWKSIAVSDPIAFGVGPSTMGAYLSQCFRSANGMMQLLGSNESPVYGKGLSVGQRLSYLSSAVSYFASHEKLIQMVLPVLVILSQGDPTNGDVMGFCARWAMAVGFYELAQTLIGRGRYQYKISEFFRYVSLFAFVRASKTLFSKEPATFRSSVKQPTAKIYAREKDVWIPHSNILALLLTAFTYGVYRAIVQYNEMGLVEPYLIGALAFTLFHSVVLFLTLKKVAIKRYFAREYRFRENMQAEILVEGFDPYPTQLNHVSGNGMSFLAPRGEFRSGNDVRVRVFLDGLDTVELGVLVKNHRVIPKSPFVHVGAQITSFASDQDRQRYLEYLYLIVPRKKLINALNPSEAQAAEKFSPAPRKKYKKSA